VETSSVRSLQVMLVNDEDRAVEGTLTLALENSSGERVASQTKEFRVTPLGQSTIYSDFKFPNSMGDFLLRTIIEYRDNGGSVSTQSRRRVKIVAPPAGEQRTQ
jgi:hypothetical protein